MRQYRIYHEGPYFEGEKIQVTDEEAIHLTRVLRLNAGDSFLAFDGKGTFAEVQATEVGKRSLSGVIKSTRTIARSDSQLILAASVTKSHHWEDMIQRCTELGITGFIPLLTDRSEVRLDKARQEKKLQKWDKVIKEALKQSERAWLPELYNFMSPVGALELSSAADVIPYALVERGGAPDGLAQMQRESRSVMILIGPEGGWSDEEIKLFKEKSIAVATFPGEVILRAETACLAAVTLFQFSIT